MITSKHILPFMLFAFITNAIVAQDMENLVSNPSFEEADGKLKKPEQLEVAAKDWFSPTEEKADLYEQGNKNELISSPDNQYGREKPMDGKRYAGAVFYSYQNKAPRTYISTELLEPLKAKVRYCVQFNISLSDLSKYAVNNVGAYLSKKDISTEKDQTLLYEAQIMDKANKIQDEQYTWTKVCGIFTAEGGEKYISIGNFGSNESTRYKKMKRPSGFKTTQKANAYYFIENVSVKAINSTSECQCQEEKYSSSEPKIVYSKQVVAEDELSTSEKINNTVVYFGSLKTELNSSAKLMLEKLAKVMVANPSANVTVVGHMDSEEQEKVNANERLIGLVEKRLESVLSYLESKGVDRSRIILRDKGSSEPLDDSGQELNKYKNRRVEFKAQG